MNTNSPMFEEAKQDPILRTFAVPTKFPVGYDLSGFFSPISIRDQVLRVCLLIDRAVELKLISGDRNLLIVGGGVAGITGAIKASKLNIPTVLIEKKQLIHKLKRNRYFCPIQYDWSAEHWDKGVFPWEDSPAIKDCIPIKLYEGIVQTAIDGIEEILNLTEANFGDFLQVHQYVTLSNDEIAIEDSTAKVVFEKHTTDDDGKEIVLNDGSYLKDSVHLPKIDEFGMIISCAGFGDEIVHIRGNDFRGIEFWSLVSHSFFAMEGNVLICGAGDGALQDFLLFTTHLNSAKAIYQELRKGEPADVKAVFDSAVHKIRCAEETAKRKEIWQTRSQSYGKAALCKIYRELQDVHEREVEKILRSDFVRQKLASLVKIDPDGHHIKLAYRCRHFSGCYALNRFLTLLIGKYIESENPKTPVFAEKTSLIDISGHSHRCSGDSMQCRQFSHTAFTTNGWTCAEEGSTALAEANGDDYRLIVIRYGIEKKRALLGEPAFPGTQILPYLIP